MDATKNERRAVDFNEACFRIRPEVLLVKDLDLAENLYQLVHSNSPTANESSNEALGVLQMTAAEIVVFGMFDGGLALVDNPWSEHSLFEDAFSHWVESNETAGVDWDEDDFEYEAHVDYESSPIPSGCYVVGREAIRFCLHLAHIDWSGLPDDLAPDLTLVDATPLDPGQKPDARDGANLIRREIMSGDWDRLLSQLKSINLPTEQ